MLMWEFGSKPTETQEYNIENQVLGGRQMGGRREVLLYFLGELVYTFYIIDVDSQLIFYIARMLFYLNGNFFERPCFHIN